MKQETADKIRAMRWIREAVHQDIDGTKGLQGLCLHMIDFCSGEGVHMDWLLHWMIERLPESKYSKEGIPEPGDYRFPWNTEKEGLTDRERFYYYRLEWIDAQIKQLLNEASS